MKINGKTLGVFGLDLLGTGASYGPRRMRCSRTSDSHILSIRISPDIKPDIKKEEIKVRLMKPGILEIDWPRKVKGEEIPVESSLIPLLKREEDREFTYNSGIRHWLRSKSRIGKKALSARKFTLGKGDRISFFLNSCFWDFPFLYHISKANLQFGLENRGYFQRQFSP